MVWVPFGHFRAHLWILSILLFFIGNLTFENRLDLLTTQDSENIE